MADCDATAARRLWLMRSKFGHRSFIKSLMTGKIVAFHPRWPLDDHGKASWKVKVILPSSFPHNCHQQRLCHKLPGHVITLLLALGRVYHSFKESSQCWAHATVQIHHTCMRASCSDLLRFNGPLWIMNWCIVKSLVLSRNQTRVLFSRRPSCERMSNGVWVWQRQHVSAWVSCQAALTPLAVVTH